MREQKELHSIGIPRLLDETVSNTWDDIKTILDAKIELLKIDVTAKISTIAELLILGVVLMAAVAFLVSTAAFYLGEFFGHTWMGFLIVSVIFFFVFLFFTRVQPVLLKNLIQKILLTVHDTTK